MRGRVSVLAVGLGLACGGTYQPPASYPPPAELLLPAVPPIWPVIVEVLNDQGWLVNVLDAQAGTLQSQRQWEEGSSGWWDCGTLDAGNGPVPLADHVAVFVTVVISTVARGDSLALRMRTNPGPRTSPRLTQGAWACVSNGKMEAMLLRAITDRRREIR